MRIEQEIKLDYKDVLIRPKRSTLKSRKEVDLKRVYRFRNSKNEWHGVPIMAANMDGVGTFEMAKALASHYMLTCITKQKSKSEWKHSIKAIPNYHVSISVGTNFDA